MLRLIRKYPPNHETQGLPLPKPSLWRVEGIKGKTRGEQWKIKQTTGKKSKAKPRPLNRICVKVPKITETAMQKGYETGLTGFSFLLVRLRAQIHLQLTKEWI